ncbi:hypothetical protein [uncultured Phocaeicola sp.]|uniref:HNH endonuclease n=1 Tax=uncultured Phocaeicola sp. TaxID=990718 RepID=UPI00321F868B
MSYDSLKTSCEKLRVDYRLFHLGKGNSIHRNASIQFDLKSHHIYTKNGAVKGLDFPETLLYLVKYYEAEDTFLVWRRYELGGAHNPNASKAEVENALTGKEEIHIVDHRQGTAYGPQSPVFVFHADHAEAFLNQIVIPELPSIADIRLLPMGKEEFASKTDVDDFILTDLKRYGLYYCRKKSFTNNPYDRIFVLFQYDGLPVGCGEKVYQKQEKTGDYSGYYEFDTNTVRLFDKPMTAGEFLPLVDNTINGFSQTLHKIDLQYLERIVSYINLNCFESDIETAIIEATKCNSTTGSEGKRVSYYGTRYERDPNLRKVAIDFCRQKNGALICEACQINYEGLYGEFGSSVIEVHHLKPLGEIRSEHNVNPETDMVCLCANCHKMIHHAIRKLGYSLTAEELRNTVLICADDKISP